MNEINFVSSKKYEPVFNFWREKSFQYGDGFSFGRQFRTTHDSNVSKITWEFDADLNRRILEITSNNETAVFTVVALGMALLFEKYSGKQNIVFHSPLLSIDHAEETVHEKRVPLLLSISSDETFKSLISIVQKNIRDCYNHQNFPFAKVDQDNAYCFGSNVLIKFDAIHADFGDAEGYDLIISLVKNDRGLGFELYHKEAVFETEFVRNMGGHFSQLLSNCFATPSVPVHQIGFLNDAEIATLLNFGTGKASDQERAALHCLFERQAAKTPAAVAIEIGGRTLTYREVNEKSNQLAHYLTDHFGVGSGDTVAIMAERSERTVIALLAILKSNAAFLPVDPGYPVERKKYLLEDAAVRVLLTDTEHIFDLDYFSGELFAMDVQLPDLDTSIDNLRSSPAGSDLCYVIYTSGSTGRPKGVEIEHASIVNYIKWANAYYFNDTDGYTFGLFTSLSFDLTLTCIFSTLLRGDKIVIYPDELELNTILRSMFEGNSDVNVVKLTPSHVSLLSHVGIKDSNVQVAIVGGEALTADQVGILRSLNASIEIYNEYGPTEATVGCTVKRIDADFDNITIGKPIDNARIYIVDRHRNLVPKGIVGEICIGGVGLARGYRNKQALTSQRFCQDPFSDGPGRLYFSGDLGMWLPNGEINYLGRKDAQVKIRGHRVELLEIETVLAEHEDVQDAHLFLDKKDENASLLALITSSARQTDAVSPDALVANVKLWCEKRLPNFMIPSSFLVMATLPINRNGKVDSQAIQKLIEQRNTARNSSYIEPSSEVEKGLAAIYGSVLKKERVGLNDDFFEMGGNSLKAVQVVSRIYKDLGLKTDLKTIFAYTTIAAMASAIASTEKDAYRGIEQIEQLTDFTVSHGQKRLWLLSQVEGLSAAYNTPAVYLINGNFDERIFTKALYAVVDRHESLRTTFKMEEGDLRQIIHDPAALQFEPRFYDFRQAPDAHDQISVVLNENAQYVFDLERGPLLKVSILRPAEFTYILSFNMHHIVTDEWSKAILFKELITLYEAYKEAKPVSLPPLRIQYKDYVQWQQEKLTGDNAKLLKDYWLGQLGGELPVLDLPTDHKRPLTKTYRGGKSTLRLNDGSVQGICGLTAEHGVSKFMVLLASVNVLLYKYSGQNDLIVGSPVSGRNHVDLESQIGFYVNTLALRNKISDHDTFESFLNKVKSNTVEAYSHQAYPFDLLVEDVDKTRDTSRSPIFDVMVVFRSKEFALAEIDKMSGLDIEHYPSALGISKFDLTFVFAEEENGIALVIEYNSDLFEQARIDRMATHFQAILGRLLEGSRVPLTDVEYLSFVERQEVIWSFNDTITQYPRHRTIVELFEEQVLLQPQAPAIFFEDERVSYAALNERANRAARFLRDSYGIQADDLIGLMVDRSIDMMVGLLAILKSGAGYVPIDPSYPEERVKFIINDAKLKTILVDDEAYSDRFKIASNTCLSMNALEEYALQQPVNNLSPVSKHSNLAYIIYTSGSTGVPKGVMIENQSVIRLVKNTNYVSLSNQSKLLLTGSINFDASTFEIWGSLLNGGELHLMKLDHLMNSATLKKYIRDNHISIMWFTASWFNQLVAEDVTLFEGLRTVLVGGERLSEVHIKKLRDALPDLEIINGYGPTENTTFSTTYRIDSVDGPNIPIGKPISNSTVYILDQNNRLVPKGIYGEICVGGDGVSRGYLNNPNLTVQKFIINPLRLGERLYRTGDIGRWLEDGNIQFLSRKDSQVKIRGFRVELEEIETALLKCDGVAEVAVIVKSDTNQAAQLVAYFVADQQVSGAQLRTSLRQMLPDYMIPVAFVRIEKMPLTANGKLDYKRLPAASDADLNDQESVVLPKTRIEKKLAKIWEEILEKPGVGINQNFFELGGHSLKAAQLVARVQKDMNCMIGFRDVFTNPTVESLSTAIGNLRYRHYEEIPVTTSQDSYEMSHAQQRLWIINQVEDTRGAYNIATTYELVGDLDKNALMLSFSTLIKRHESLRTNFFTEEGRVRQRILDMKYLPLEFVELTKGEAEESLIEERVRYEVLKPFDLEHDPLIRAAVIKVGVNKHILTLTFHHIIGDGLSMQNFFREFVSLYNAYHAGQDPALAPLRIQYKDYSTWHNNFLSSTDALMQKNFWLGKFTEPMPALNLPADHARPRFKSYEADTVVFRLDGPLMQSLKETSRRNGATLFMTLQALVKTMLHAYTGQGDITLGTLTAGREHPDLADQIGFYVNTLSIRTIFDRNDTFQDVLQKVKDSTLEAYENQMYPFDLLLADLAANGVAVKNPFFDVLITYEKQSQEINVQELTGIEASKYKLGRNVCHFDLDFNFAETEDHIEVYLAYCVDIYKRDRIARMAQRFVEIATAVTENPGNPIHTLLEKNTVEGQLLEIWQSIDGHLLSGCNGNNVLQQCRLNTSLATELCKQLGNTFGIDVFITDIDQIASHEQMVSYVNRLMSTKHHNVPGRERVKRDRKLHEVQFPL